MNYNHYTDEQQPEELIRITVDLGSGKEPDCIVVYQGQEEMTHHLAH